MGKLSLKFVSMVLLLLFGILLGMNMAEKGIYRVAGNPELNPQSLQVMNNEEGIAVKVLGKTYVTELPKKDTIGNKKTSDADKLQHTSSELVTHVSFISKVGNKLGDLFQIGAEKGLEIVSKILD